VILILAGMGCFLLPLACDAADTCALRIVWWLCVLLGPLLYLGFALALLVDPWRLALPIGVRIVTGAAAAPFLILLVQSLLIEIRGTGAGSARPRPLVTTGTYALVRHPGVLWYLFFHLFLGIAAGSIPFLIAAPLWAGLNTAVAAVQDRFFFPRVFGAPYDEYRRAVPFLIPSRASLRRCLATLNLLSVSDPDR
jgi:protein-S-isoprenylcysteine O-methyltransferase Ste14